jgi:hypothetical protein
MNRILFIALATVIVTGGLLGVSMAGHHYHGYHGCGMGMSQMSELDGDQNGVITLEEFSAPQMERLTSAFKMLDTNNDNVIDQSEWNEFLKVHGIEPTKEG